MAAGRLKNDDLTILVNETPPESRAHTNPCARDHHFLTAFFGLLFLFSHALSSATIKNKHDDKHQAGENQEGCTHDLSFFLGQECMKAIRIQSNRKRRIWVTSQCKYEITQKEQIQLAALNQGVSTL